MTDLERLRGGILGLLLGDALGVPYEFHPPQRIPATVEMTPPSHFPRAHRGVPPGTWSDDGAMALCLLESLLERQRLDVDDLAGRFLAWYFEGHLAVDGRVFDVGNQTAEALTRIRRGAPVLEAASAHPQSNGNGSLMRALPLALWHQGSDQELVDDAHLQSRVTHPHPRSQACCALYCLWARGERAGRPSAWDDAVRMLREVYAAPEYAAFRAELDTEIRPEDPSLGRGTGYVVDTLRSARDVAGANPAFDDGVRAAVALGHDTDTTACVVGGILGVRLGSGALPEAWLGQLRGQALLQPLLGRLR